MNILLNPKIFNNTLNPPIGGLLNQLIKNEEQKNSEFRTESYF
jgi:hypothetical protein